ncbi:MAG: hypothetical protein Q9222_003764 [Ikaeria aurantiellina]
MDHQTAAAVDYDDDFEKANASLQVAWSGWMDENSHYKMSSFYKKVKCLMISWDKSCDDLHTEKETLLLVYYAGHGSPKPSGDGITLTG